MLAVMIRSTIELAVLTLAAMMVLASCASGSESTRSGEGETAVSVDEKAMAAGPVGEKAMSAEPAGGSDAKTVTLQGTVIQKPWSKSMESWNAGGSEYYVLDVGTAEIAHRSAKEGVTLKATDAVSMDALSRMIGKRVEVSGSYVQAKPYTPKGPVEQYPTGMNGEPIPRGAGFSVISIKAL